MFTQQNITQLFKNKNKTRQDDNQKRHSENCRQMNEIRKTHPSEVNSDTKREALNIFSLVDVGFEPFHMCISFGIPMQVRQAPGAREKVLQGTGING